MNSSNTCILQVEDNEDDILLLRLAFKHAGITNPVQVVTTGQSAMDYLAGKAAYADRATYPKPGLVLLDLKLPDRPGLEVLEWIRDQPAWKGLPVVVLSSWGSKADIDYASHVGSNSYILKPMDIQQYQEFAQRLKSNWLSSSA
jgi:CheY-like chemotaxis protein